MPLTKISAPKYLAASQVRALARAVQDALVASCQVPPNDLFQTVSRFQLDDLVFDPHFGGVNRSGDACLVEILFLTGRTDDQKRALFRHIADKAVQAGFRADDIMVALLENSRMDWSLGHGVAYADIHAKA